MGLYTPREAACFAKLRAETFNRWFFGDSRYDRVLRPRIEAEQDRLITFCDLIQAVAVRTLRLGRLSSKVTLSHIRSVVTECEQEKRIDYPLARHHTLFWFSNRLVLRIDKDAYVGLTAQVDMDQLYSAKIIEPFLSEVKFDKNDGLARVWTPLLGRNFRVELNADRRFGMPTIEPGGILVNALVDAVDAEGSERQAADAFETSIDAVQLALKYNEYLQSAA